jgi:hypothetical protein
MADEKKSTASREDILAVLRQYVPSETLKLERDMLAGRYRLLMGQPLPDLGSPVAKAYAVSDTRDPNAQLYALVFDNEMPLRQKNIDFLKEFRHPNMVSLPAAGMADISILSEARFVAVMERPSGKSISKLLEEENGPFPQDVLTQQVLRPLVEILKKFSRAGISHNRINLDNIYWTSNGILLGECVSEPSGFSQDFLFEPVERILTSPLAKADYSISSDCYAVAVLVLHLALGFKPFANARKEEFVENLLLKGSYSIMVLQWDFSDILQDFFRGLLNDGRRERWDPDSMDNWLSGRRFNFVLPSQPNEASRGFDLMGQIYYNRKAVANTLFNHWQDARAVLADTKLGRWVETSVHKPEIGELIIRVAHTASSDARHERHNSDALARTLILLDPTGPIRMKELAVMVDGIGYLFANAYLTGKQEIVRLIVQMLEGDLPWFWQEQQGGTGSADYSAALWKLQRVRSYMRINAPGFGIERCIYELHPGLACQSRLVKRYHATTLRELLLALDALAQQKAGEEEFMDRHIAGFIAAKLDIGKEVKIGELEVIPKLGSHAGLIGLRMLIRAQAKADDVPLRGLCYWAAVSLLPLIGDIHKRSIREKLEKELLEAASTGTLKNIAMLLLDPEVFIADYNGFLKVSMEYHQRKTQITELKNNTLLMRHSRIAGRGIAQTVAYGVALLAVYYTLKAYLHF